MKWNSIKNITPDKGSIVLVCGHATSTKEILVIGMATYHHGSFKLIPFLEQGYTKYFFFQLKSEDITHWMPLPLPPEVK